MPQKEQQCQSCEFKGKALHLHMRAKHPVQFTPVGVSELNKDTEGNNKLNLGKLLEDLNKRLDKIEKEIGPRTATEQIAVFTGPPVSEEDISDAGPSDMKCHPKHREMVDNILGNQFKAWESYDVTDSTHFLFSVQVPSELSPLSKGELDIRSRSVLNAEGENGVRQWLILVRKNLNQYYSQNGIKAPFETSLSE